MDYKKYKWFYTLSGKLVVGGKSADQNEELLKSLTKEHIVMHTSDPGSPFSVIISDADSVNPSDIEETAVFTACFSQAWKAGKKKTSVDIFKSSQLYKNKSMKTGTWGVSGKVKKLPAELKLVLTKQKGQLRAVPISSVLKEGIIATICPGNIDKLQMHKELEKIGISINPLELSQALPAGGSKICR